jgi:uncharacterized protein
MDDLRPPPPPVPELHGSEIAPVSTEVPWRAREAFLIALIGIVTAFFFTMLAIATIDDTETSTLVATIFFEVGIGFWTVMWVKLRYNVGLSALKLRFRKGDVGMGLLSAVIGMGAVTLVSQVVARIFEVILGRQPKAPEQLPEIVGGVEITLAVIAVTIVAPLAEETFFRGFLYQALRKWKGVTWGAAISALFFALAHFSPIILPGLFALGFIFAHVFERQDSLGASIVGHATYNFIVVILLLSGVVET